MSDFLFDLLQQQDAEMLYVFQEKTSGLKAIVAIHDMTLGPAAGGIRMWPYTSEREAIQDAMRLARAMTYKWAAAGVNLGGGKCVVIADPTREKTEALLRCLGRFLQRLNGQFLTGTDVGTTIADMGILAQECSYIVPVSEVQGGSGDSGPATALGVIQGMRACLQARYASSDLHGRTVAVQGIGSVGRAIVERLIQAGAVVTIADIDRERVEQIAATSAVHVASPEEIMKLPVDIYCPCALGGVINDTTISELRCQIVCGSANNQLAEERHGELLANRGILYAPDYIVNAGGALWSVESVAPGGFNRQRAEASVARIYETTTAVIDLARDQQISTARAADLLAERRIAEARTGNRIRTTHASTDTHTHQ
jgi:leucine dehydrogenase